MKNILRKSFLLLVATVCAGYLCAGDVTFTMSSIFDGNSLTFEVTTPTAATVSSNTSKSNAKAGKLGSDGHYFEIILKNEIFTAASINGYINTTDKSKNWAFQFSTDGGTNWSTEVTQANDGNKTAHDIAVGATIPANANGFRVVRRAGTSTLVNSITLTLGSTGPSTDATLKSIVYGGDLTPVPNFSSDKLDYEVELPANYVGGAPSVQATANDAAADVKITQATTLPGTATIKVTAEDGTTTKTYTVTFSRESAFPKVERAAWANIRGTATIDQVNLTITGQVLNGSSLTLEPQFTGKNIQSWTPQGAQNFSNGAINYTFQSSTSETTVYAVTISEAPAASSDATLKSLTYGGTSVPNFSPSTYAYNIELKAGIKTPPTIAATANDAKATVNITQAQSVPGSGKVEVTAEDGTTTLTYTINYTVTVPPSGLIIHVPEKYEAKDIAGGYNTPLTVVSGYEYEVYYTQRTSEGDYPTFSTTLATEGKATGISGSTSKTENVGRDGDQWFKGTVYSTSECKSATAVDEFDFETKMIREHRLSASDTYQFHVQGFDQFSLWGMDKKIDPKNGNQVFVVKIDGVEQPTDASLYNTTAYTVRRYNMTTGEHLIEISTTCTGSNVCYMGGFSLRVAQQPRTKWLKGNDSTQTVYARGTIKTITYVTKYNNIPGAETKLEWLGTAVEGLSLQKIDGKLTDTLLLSGIANAPAAEYQYAVVAYYNGAETSRAKGKFKIINSIQAMTDTVIDAYQNEEMDEIKCKYFVYDENADLHFNWDPSTGAPGVTTTAKNGTFIIGGTPTEVGTYRYIVAVTEGDTITGRIVVKPLDLGNNPIMYLYKNNLAYEHDGVYNYLKNSGRNLIVRKAKSDLRSPDQYNKYKWILISEDVDANNPEVFKIIHGGTNLPVLNMKAFSYAHPIDSLTTEWGGIWGEANNGSITENGKFITVERDDHPIFKALKKKKGDKIQVLDSIDRRGLMPIRVTKAGSLCLATSLTRDIEDYYGDGEEQTFLHEIPAELTGRAKYICMPIAKNSSEFMTDEGKNLLNKVIEYLLSSDKSVAIPELRMTRFAVNGIAATPNEANSTFKLEIDTTLYPDIDLTSVVPDIELASPYTHTEPAIGDTIDLSIAQYIPIEYVVTDYITRRVYEISVRLFKPQGIEEVYSAGQWVNIYDIYGRKIATTNEDIYTMTLPRGMYIVVTESGQTLKIMK